MISTFRRRARWAVFTPFILIALLLLWAFLAYPFTYVSRTLLWQGADVHDYEKFPARPLEPAAAPFHFTAAPEEARVQALFAANPSVGDLDKFLARNGTQAFIVIQDDRILYEKYYNGYNRDSIVTSFSVAKSFGSALIGIAIKEGYIGSVDDPITKYLPELRQRGDFDKVTIRNLLTMSSGIKYKEFNFLQGDNTKTYYYPNLRQLALGDTQIAEAPGRHFVYNNYHPLLLGLILERATGRPVTQYLQEKIWTPLGMEYPGSWSLDSKADGFEKMESGLNARAIDFAKLGRLYLNEGNWNGVQVVPSDWVTRSVSEDQSVDRATYYPNSEFFTAMNGYYGQMWWGMRRGVDGHDFFAYGNLGQYIYVSPAKNLIIVRFGERYGVPSDQWLQAFYRFASDIPASPEASK